MRNDPGSEDMIAITTLDAEAGTISDNSKQDGIGIKLR